MRKTIKDDVIERAQSQKQWALEAISAYMGPTGRGPDPRIAQRYERISSDPTASELLARGYGVGIADEAARRIE